MLLCLIVKAHLALRWVLRATMKLLSTFLASVCCLSAQVGIVDSDLVGNQVSIKASYYQNFDSLSPTASNAPWINNGTMVGWYTNQASYSANGGNLADYGSSGQADRALGGISALFGIAFSNSSSFVIGDFEVLFTGEQWTVFGNSPHAADKIFFEYQVFGAGEGSVTAGTWNPYTTLDFTAPNAPPNTTALLDGNSSENRVCLSSEMTGLYFQPGQEIWFRWRAVNELSYNDYALGIDDLSISFGVIPEPASSAALLGFAALGLAAWRRPRKV